MRTALTTLWLAVALAAPLIVVGLGSGGPYAGRVLQGGVVLLVPLLLLAAWMARRGPALDREQDEREGAILRDTALATCLVTAVALQAYWGWRFAAAGNAGDDAFWLLVVFWGTMAIAYGLQRWRRR
jgi:hypothetical protein